MPFEPKFTQADIEKMIAIRVRRIENAIVNRLVLIGEQFVRNAREKGSYNDVTGNLRSSIGYVVLKNGKVISENTKEAGKGSDKRLGLAKAEEYIKEIVSRNERGFILVGFAGMEYAAAVESRGKDVITSSAIDAKEQLKRAIKTIDKKVLPN